MPENTQSTGTYEGEVVAAGPGAKNKDGVLLSLSVSVGDKVLLPQYGGVPLKIDGEELFLYRDEEILAKFSS